MGSHDFAAGTYTASPAAVTELTDLIARFVPEDRALRLLEIGCGTGELLCGLASILPLTTMTGIDISPGNIEQARQRAQEAGMEQHLQFRAGDYLSSLFEEHDVIISVSTLHLIDQPTERILGKVVEGLAPGGLFIFTMPDNSLFNHALWLLRRFFRLIRSPWLDRVVLRVATKLHGSDLRESLLRERIEYMYLLPFRYLGPGLRRDLRGRFGRGPLADLPLPHVSLAQPRHRFCVYQRGVS